MRPEQIALPLLRQINRRPRLAPVLDTLMQPFNIFGAELDADPYPTYSRLRTRGPIIRHRALNNWVVSSYDLCE